MYLHINTSRFQFKQLMLQLDPDDPDEEENNKVLTALSTGAPSATGVMPVATGGGSVLTEADQVTLSNYKVTTYSMINNYE